MLTESAVATAADYADALLTARRAKNIIVLLLLLMLLVQVALFLTVKFTSALDNQTTLTPAALTSTPLPTATPTTAPAEVVATPLGAEQISEPAPATKSGLTSDALKYGSAISLTAVMMLGLALPLVLLLITHIMLVGRLIGAGSVTSAVVLSFLLVVLLFPWQTVLNEQDLTKTDFILPGITTTWREISTRAETPQDTTAAVLYWFRFVGAPAVGVIMLLAIQLRSGRGLKLALGEAELAREAEAAIAPYSTDA